MTEERKVICDGCGEDCTYTGNIVDYRLRLSVEQKVNKNDFGTLLGVQPPIPHNLDFCGLACLRKWQENYKPYWEMK